MFLTHLYSNYCIYFVLQPFPSYLNSKTIYQVKAEVRSSIFSDLIFLVLYQKGAIISSNPGSNPHCHSRKGQNWAGAHPSSPSWLFPQLLLHPRESQPNCPPFSQEIDNKLRGNCPEKRMYAHLTEQVRLSEISAKARMTKDILFFFFTNINTFFHKCMDSK